MKKVFLVFCIGLLALAAMTKVTLAADCKEGEKQVFGEMKAKIPPERIKSTDDLYKLWQDVQTGTSKSVIIDLRTEAEFDSGHIKGANNVDSGHAYSVPEKWPDPNTEIWVFCRTQHRATYFAGLLYQYGYRNVYLVDKGIVGWIEKGYPLVNKYLGEIKVTKYEKKLKEDYAYRENK
jgi:rhodanese-related sulfurtransferase